MAINLNITSISAVASTTARVNLVAGGGTVAAIQLQLASRNDFEWVVAPIFEIPNANPYDLVGLNQSQNYFLRGRFRYNDGTVDDWTALQAFRTTQAAPQVTAPASIVVDPAIIVIPEDIIGWTVGSALTGFPGKNVSRDAPVAWRSLNVATGQHSITIQHSGAPWDTLAILNSNMPEAATVNVRIGATAAAAAVAGTTVLAAPFRASANLPGRPGYHSLIRLAAPVSQPFTKIEINGMTPGGVLHVEHIIIGLNRKSKNHALDMTESPLHLGSMERTRAGNPDRQLGLRMRRVEFDLAFLSEAQHETLYQDLYRRIDEPILVVPNSKAGYALHDRILFGDLKGRRVAVPTSVHRTTSFVVESLI